MPLPAPYFLDFIKFEGQKEIQSEGGERGGETCVALLHCLWCFPDIGGDRDLNPDPWHGSVCTWPDIPPLNTDNTVFNQLKENVVGHTFIEEAFLCMKIAF